MQYKEYGKQNRDVIILLHGGGLSWWNYREVSERLQHDFRIIIPILDGHAGSDEISQQSKTMPLKSFLLLIGNFGGSVLLIGGLSLGGQILLEMLSRRKDLCRFAMVESAAVIPSKLTYSLIKPAFGSCYELIRQKWFSKLQFRSLRMKPELFNDYYQDTCGITKQNMIAFLTRKFYVFHEEVSWRVCGRNPFVCRGAGKQTYLASARKLHETLEKSSLNVLPAMYHGEFSINHADLYVKDCVPLLNSINFQFIE